MLLFRRFSAALPAAFALLLVPAPGARGDQGSPPKESASETLTLNPLTPAEHKFLELQEQARIRRLLGLRFAKERKKWKRKRRPRKGGVFKLGLPPRSRASSSGPNQIPQLPRGYARSSWLAMMEGLRQRRRGRHASHSASPAPAPPWSYQIPQLPENSGSPWLRQMERLQMSGPPSIGPGPQSPGRGPGKASQSSGPGPGKGPQSLGPGPGKGARGARPMLREGTHCVSMLEHEQESPAGSINYVLICCARDDAACMPTQREILKELHEGIVGHGFNKSCGRTNIHDPNEALCARRICSCPAGYLWNYSYDKCLNEDWAEGTPACEQVGHCWTCE